MHAIAGCSVRGFDGTTAKAFGLWKASPSVPATVHGKEARLAAEA